MSYSVYRNTFIYMDIKSLQTYSLYIAYKKRYTASARGEPQQNVLKK